MAHNSRIRTAGLWTLNSVLTPAEMESFDLAQFQAVNGDAGGVWAPLTEIEIAGAGFKINNAPFTVLTSAVSFTGPSFTVANDTVTFSGSGNFSANVGGAVSISGTTVTVTGTGLMSLTGLGITMNAGSGAVSITGTSTVNLTGVGMTFNNGVGAFLITGTSTFDVQSVGATVNAGSGVLAILGTGMSINSLGGAMTLTAVGTMAFNGAGLVDFAATHSRVDVGPELRALGNLVYFERVSPSGNGRLAMRHFPLTDADQTRAVTAGQFFTMDTITANRTLTLANANAGDFCWVRVNSSGGTLSVETAAAVLLLNLQFGAPTFPYWALFMVNSVTGEWEIMTGGDRTV